MRQPLGEGGKDGGFGVPADTDDEGKAEFFAVGGVQGRKPFEFFARQVFQASALLFGGRSFGQGNARAEFRMGANQGELFIFARLIHDGGKRGVKGGFVSERAAGESAFWNPG